MALEPGSFAQQDDGRGYRELQPPAAPELARSHGGLTAEDGRNYAKREMREHVVRVDPRTLAGSQVSGTLVPIDAPTSVKLADVAERHADMFNADDLAVINAGVVELQAYELSREVTVPVNVDVPYASQEADQLLCTMGNWEGDPSSYTYQWKFDGMDVGTASDVSTYLVTAADAGRTATCIVTAHTDQGMTAAPPSNPVTIEAPAA